MLSPASPRSSSLWNISEGREMRSEPWSFFCSFSTLTDTGQGSLHALTKTKDLDFRALGNGSSLDTASSDGTW